MSIRRGERRDFGRLQEIERAAGRMFATVGLDFVAEDEPFSDDELAEFLAHGGVGVLGDPAAGYIAARWVDGCLHVEQVPVHPGHSHRGIGRSLIAFVARRSGLPLTLTAYTDVPWNGPYYARLGFRALPDDELS